MTTTATPLVIGSTRFATIARPEDFRLVPVVAQPEVMRLVCGCQRVREDPIAPTVVPGCTAFFGTAHVGSDGCLALDFDPEFIRKAFEPFAATLQRVIVEECGLCNLYKELAACLSLTLGAQHPLHIRALRIFTALLAETLYDLNGRLRSVPVAAQCDLGTRVVFHGVRRGDDCLGNSTYT